jgi:hypothetical protein
MRVGPHIDARAGRELGGPHLIEKDERADTLLLCRRQQAADFKAADITRTRHDDSLQRLAARRRYRIRLVSGLPSHRASGFSSSALIKSQE